MSDPQCETCYPPRFDEQPSELSLLPDACPARGNHAIITRAFAYLGRLESGLHGPIRDQLVAKVRADIDRYRQPAEEA